MQFSEETIQILKNFATINPSMHFRPGNQQITISPDETIVGKATFAENIPLEFGIYEFNKFLSVLSLFDKDSPPDIEFDTRNLTISQGSRRAHYGYCDIGLIKSVKKEHQLPVADLGFRLPQVTFSQIMKAANVMQLPNLAFVGDGSKISAKVFNLKGSTKDHMTYEVGDSVQEFETIFDVLTLKMLPRDYDVQVCHQGLTYFVAENLEYVIASTSVKK